MVPDTISPSLDMWRARKPGGFRRGGKHAGQQNAFRVSRPEPGMNTSIDLVKSIDDVTAKGQQFFVRSQRHGWFSPISGFGPPNTVPAPPPIFKSAILR